MSASDQQQIAALSKYGYDAAMQASWQRGVADGTFAPAHNVVTEPLEPPPPDAFASLPEPGTAEHEESARVGREAIARGELA
ncbi:MAG: hypothetical protein KAI24_03595, partial [Planctomycetes bacterium]|nr:hypothetical protein [Planctomycetota bacterium]